MLASVWADIKMLCHAGMRAHCLWHAGEHQCSFTCCTLQLACSAAVSCGFNRAAIAAALVYGQYGVVICIAGTFADWCVAGHSFGTA